MTPFIVQPSGTAWGAAKSLFGSVSWTSGKAPTLNVRKLLMPVAVLTRTAWKPIGQSGAAVRVALMLFASTFSILLTVMPGR